ncbi:MAG: hypothetical protein ACKVQW_11690 [Pyrinomonadaceae bacterium]
MLYNLRPANVNKNYLARLDFLDLCLLGETGTGKTRAAKLTLTKRDHQAAVGKDLTFRGPIPHVPVESSA